MDMERKEAYIRKLREIEAEYGDDPEVAHAAVDDVMIEIIRYHSKEIADTIEDLEITWWYA